MQRVTVNPKNGRTEHVHVSLEALYPNTGSPGIELSFEELMASHRGWLNKIWKAETPFCLKDSLEVEDKANGPNPSANGLSGDISDSLISTHDPHMLDENGFAKETNREGKARKMRVKEINETQISKSQLTGPCYETYEM